MNKNHVERRVEVLCALCNYTHHGTQCMNPCQSPFFPHEADSARGQYQLSSMLAKLIIQWMHGMYPRLDTAQGTFGWSFHLLHGGSLLHQKFLKGGGFIVFREERSRMLTDNLYREIIQTDKYWT